MTDVPFVTGAAFAITRETIQTIGLLDEGFSPFYFEEVDYCTRVLQSGRRVVVVPTAVGLHDESSSIRPDSIKKLQSFHRNRLRYVLKHYRLDGILTDFLPAELVWMQAPENGWERPALRAAYLAAFFTAEELLPPAETDPAVAIVKTKLLELWQAAQAEENELLTTALKQHQLQEFTFQSRVPALGGLFSRLRAALYSLFAKWPVRFLQQQQMAYNRQVTELLRAQQAQIAGARRERALLLQELQHLQQQVERLEKSVVRKDNAAFPAAGDGSDE